MVCLYSSSLQLLFQQKICKSASDRAAGKPHTPCDWASCVKERGLMRSSPVQSFSPLSRSYHVSFSLSFPSSPAYCRYFCSWLSPVSLLRSLLSLFSSCKSSCRLHKYERAFLVLSYALHLICFRVVLASFTLTTMAVGNTSEGFAFVISPWSIWALKNSSNGYYYTSHMHPWAGLAKTSASIFAIWVQSRRTQISHSLCMC